MAHKLVLRRGCYRLTDRREPTDQMLDALMSAVAVDVQERAAAAHRSYFAGLWDAVRLQQQRWEQRMPATRK